MIQYPAIEAFMIIAYANIRRSVDKSYKNQFMQQYILCICDINIKMTHEHFYEELFIIKYLETFQQEKLKFSINHKSIQLFLERII